MGLRDRIKRLRRKPLGYKVDAKDRRDWGLDALSLGGPKLPRYHTLIQHCPPVYDQGRTNSCVAQTFAAALETRERMRQRFEGTPSRLFIYAHARAAHGAVRSDKGTYLRLAAQTLSALGAPPEKFWPFDSPVNRRPSWQASMQAHARMGGGYYRIFGTGLERIRGIRTAIEAGYPVAFGTSVADSFLPSFGPSVIGPPKFGDPIVGGHAMLIVAYQPGRFLVRNSWGPHWRDRGYAWLTEDYILHQSSRDFWIVAGWNLDKD